jgi:hypothetical protein
MQRRSGYSVPKLLRQCLFARRAMPLPASCQETILKLLRSSDTVYTGNATPIMKRLHRLSGTSGDRGQDPRSGSFLDQAGGQCGGLLGQSRRFETGCVISLAGGASCLLHHIAGRSKRSPRGRRCLRFLPVRLLVLGIGRRSVAQDSLPMVHQVERSSTTSKPNLNR